MDLTEGTFQEKNERAKISMMWFAMISMFMTFAGLLSAYIVSSKREDWLIDFQLPNVFVVSLATIFLSSICFYLAKKAIVNEQKKLATSMLFATFATGVLFVWLQFKGFGEILDLNLHPTGGASNVKTSFIYIIVFVHLLHIVGGLLVLTITIKNHLLDKYTKNNHLGITLAGMYWHFVDVLWVCLFCFLYFMR